MQLAYTRLPALSPLARHSVLGQGLTVLPKELKKEQAQKSKYLEQKRVRGR